MVVWSRMALTPGVCLLFRNTALKIMEIFMEVNSILRLSPFPPTEFQCQTHTVCSYLVRNTYPSRLLLRMVSFRVHVPTKWIYGPHRAKVPLLNVPTLFSFSQPPVAPSSTSETRREDFRQGLRKLMKNKSIILLVFAYALSQGVQEALLPVLNLDFEPLGIKEVMNPEITWLLFVILV